MTPKNDDTPSIDSNLEPEAPVAAPAEAPAEATAEVPAEAPAKAPAKTPAKAPARAPREHRAASAPREHRAAAAPRVRPPVTTATPAAPAPKPSFSVPILDEGVHFIFGTGRRKKAVARVRIRPGTGKILVNKRDFEVFFVHQKDRSSAASPLHTTGMANSLDVWVNVNGGGSTGQADAVKLGLARAIARAIPEAEQTLRDSNLMTRDARIKERKKYGLRGARRRFQFSKR